MVRHHGVTRAHVPDAHRGDLVEVQLELKDDDRKFFTWPSYVANLRAYLECETCVLVGNW